MSDERRHFVLRPSAWVGACSDVGRRHDHNQDAISLATTNTPPGAIVAVADGVTTAPNSAEGAVLAASAASSTLRVSLASEPPERAILTAFAAAQSAVLSGAPTAACTLVAAVVHDGAVHVGSVGDSRAYWVTDAGESSLLSVDDSVAQVRMDLGMGRGEAESGIDSHTITRWLGRSAPDVSPAIGNLITDSPGWLIVCSDGLWNYASEPSALGDVVAQTAEGITDAADLAEALVAWANQQGGRDNISVAAVRMGHLATLAN